jgi:hypothetical protein
MKTAVEFLLEKYKSQNTLLFAEDFEQAKEMEKEQIEMAFFKGLTFGKTLPDGLTAEQYYSESFKQEQ